MSKSIIWNQLKSLGYEAKKLKAVYDVSYQQASKELLESILASLENEVGEGVNESLSSCCGGVTGNDVNSANATKSIKGQEYKLFLPEVIPAIVEKLDDNNTYKVDRGTGHTPVVYHLCIDNKDGQTKLLVIIGSWIALSTIQMYYRDNLISKAIKPEVTSTIVATETSGNVTTFKGIPVEHFNHASDAWLSAMGNNLDNSVLISTDTYEGTPLVNINNGGEIVFTSSFLESLKLANHYLTTEDEQIAQAIEANIPHQYAAVLGGQQQKQVLSSEPLPGSLVLSPKHLLKPKMYLFATMTEFVFLMECYLDLIGHFFNLSSSYAEISNEIYVSWCAITAICFNRYVRMPAIGSDNYSKLLNIWYQSA